MYMHILYTYIVYIYIHMEYTYKYINHKSIQNKIGLYCNRHLWASEAIQDLKRRRSSPVEANEASNGGCNMMIHDVTQWQHDDCQSMSKSYP
jgi:formylglycine-generating enzyme required for sulfatase activity